MERKIYLDNNSTTLVDRRVVDLIVAELTDSLGNPSSLHSFGKAARSKLNRARQEIASFLKVKPEEIIFTSGGTEGANLLLRGLFPPSVRGSIVTSSIEHAAVFETLKSLESDTLRCVYLQPGLLGALTPSLVKDALQPDTKAIVLMAVNNETGVKTDLEAIASIAKEMHIPFIVDGVALLGKEPFSLPDGVSAMFFSGHKLHASKGVGFVFIKSSLKLSPLFTGGEQEFRRRAGTENLPAIVGLAKAVQLLQEELPQASERMLHLRVKFESSLLSRLPECRINGTGPRTTNTSNIAFIGIEGEILLAKLDLAGIAASHGSACSSGAIQPSRILLNMGLPLDTAASSIRFSLSRYTTAEEIDRAVELIVGCVQGLR